ncbi:molybdopterin molybdenumtransferase MoeA [Lysobacter sp. TY2-98]|uniref:molybdopterin molybdotransferase MoeA n=1 Tax=Lysobacter sp. TY2-98 TaxID=2290922 RepID=UPI000E206FBD|nr:molybdopterin molybdotransferase MoeA [Lysobacter sp. TY2-98]AXK71495.1 molybdopterin molybdenumtransferase MoeA [Lysobacter sp. TY2-98]
MIDYDDALRRLLDAAKPLPSERIDAADAIGRILAAPLTSAESLPPFDNSAMDGFALRTAGEPIAAGTEFDVQGGRAAGDGAAQATSGAWEIMTGARMPDGLDAIVPIEQVDVLDTDADGRPSRIRLTAAVTHAQHLRRAGEDIAAATTFASPGALIDPAMRMLCASVGIATVDVVRRPRVALINTGRELVDDPRQPLDAGQIRNSNGPFLAARLQAASADVVGARTVGDDIDAFLEAIASLPPHVVILSTGAVSMGRFDFVPEALARLGATTLFHKVRIRPGKPILAATLPSGALFFGLPGNPASTAVGLRFFVEPVLRAMLGLPPEVATFLPLRAAYTKRVPLRMHLKARVALDADARAGVEVLGGQESFRIRPLLDANAWAVVEPDVDVLDAGARVRVMSRGHLEPLSVTS